MRSNARFSAAALALIITALWAASAFADAYHYRNILVGERASGMGGAYTGVSDDPSGMYYNPAGIVYSQGTNLSASANAYHSTTKTYKNAIGGYNWTRKASALLPNYFGVTQAAGKDSAIGMSYVVPDSIIEDQDQTFSGIPSRVDTDGDGTAETASTISTYSINFNNEDRTYNYGPSFATKISDNMSIGATLYVHQRRNQWIMNQYIVHSTAHYEWNNTYYETEEWGLRPIAGIMWAPTPKSSVGLTLTKTFVYDSRTQIINLRKPTYSNVTTRTELNSTGKRKYPLHATLGLAYFPSDSVLLSGDVSYHGAANDDFYGKRKAIANAALGAEYYMNEYSALRMGLYSNRSSAPKVEDGRTGQAEHVDMYGGSMSLSYFGKGTSLTLGGSYGMGSGKAQVVEGSSNSQNMDMETWTIFLSSSYSY